MLRFLAHTVISLIADAVALIVAALILDDMGLNGVGFVIAIAIFAGCEMLITPLVRQVAITRAPVLLGSTALVATLISLIVTKILSSGLQISGGIATWVLATVIVWAVSLATKLLLPVFMFKKVLAQRAANS